MKASNTVSTLQKHVSTQWTICKLHDERKSLNLWGQSRPRYVTTQYTADYSPVVLQHLLNHDMEKLSSWFASNYLQVNEDKTQAMILGNSSYRYDLEFAGTPIDINNHLKILGICLDNKLSFREHISIMLKKVYSKIGALRRLKRQSH